MISKKFPSKNQSDIFILPQKKNMSTYSIYIQIKINCPIFQTHFISVSESFTSGTCCNRSNNTLGVRVQVILYNQGLPKSWVCFLSLADLLTGSISTSTTGFTSFIISHILGLRMHTIGIRNVNGWDTSVIRLIGNHISIM